MELGNPKNAFLEAFLLAGVVFILGLFIGVAVGNSRVDKINNYYANSEVSSMDILALTGFTISEKNNCDEIINSNIEFADKVYEEASLLEKYEESGDSSEKLLLAHKKYDLLRVFLWNNVIKARQMCPSNFSYIVYLYEYNNEDLNKKAENSVWSKILSDLKQELGNSIILIPIAVDNNLVSLDLMLSNFKIKEFPAIIINDKQVITELKSAEELKKYMSD